MNESMNQPTGTKTLAALLAATVALTPMSTASAAAPQRIAYQGTLRKSGKLFTGDSAFIFRITDADGGSQYWTSGSTTVAVDKGLFRYPLGTPNEAAFAAIAWADVSPYVEVTVDGDLLLPREPLASVPYAFTTQAAADAVQKAGDTVTGTLMLDGTGSHFDTSTQEGIRIATHVYVTAGGLEVAGAVAAASFSGDGSALTGVTGGGFTDGGETGGANRSLGNTDAFSLGLLTNNQTRLRILSDGKVGIGTASPGTELEVNGTVTATAFAGDGSALTGISTGVGGVENAGSTTIGADTDSDGAGVIVFQTKTAARMTVANDGKVGIGTASPGTELEVNGTVTATAFAGDGSALAGISTVSGGAVDNSDITLKGGAAPAPTAEGRLEWDSDDDRLVAGTGAGQSVFYSGAHTANTDAESKCAAGQFLEGDGACTDVLEEAELDSLAELNAQLGTSIADGPHTGGGHGDGTDCPAGQYARGVDANGNAQSCAADDDAPDSDAEVPDAITVSGGAVDNSDITLKGGAAPAPTAEGRLEWDSDDDRLVAGTGAGQSVFYPGAHTANTDAESKCAAGQFLEGDGACTDVLEEAELDSLAELNAQLGTSIADGPHTGGGHGDGTDCPAGQYARGVDANGNAQSCTADVDTIGCDGSDSCVSNGITICNGMLCAPQDAEGVGGWGVQGVAIGALVQTGARLDILGSSSDRSKRAVRIKDSGYNGVFAIFNDGSVSIGTDQPPSMGAGYALQISGNAAKPGGSTWDASSDERLKDVGGDFRAGLGEILKLRPVYYRYKKNNPLNLPSDKVHVGLIAQQVQAVIPDAISEDAKGYLVFKADPVLWAMLNAIKEQQRQIDELRSLLESRR